MPDPARHAPAGNKTAPWRAAQALEFERAAVLRDELWELWQSAKE